MEFSIGNRYTKWIWFLIKQKGFAKPNDLIKLIYTKESKIRQIEWINKSKENPLILYKSWTNKKTEIQNPLRIAS
jgi:hypothetical protein